MSKILTTKELKNFSEEELDNEYLVQYERLQQLIIERDRRIIKEKYKAKKAFEKITKATKPEKSVKIRKRRKSKKTSQD